MKPRLLPSLRLALALLLPAAGQAAGDLVVVVNPRSGVEKLSREDVTNIFLGRYRQFPSGLTAVPLELPQESLERTQFYWRLVGKSPAEINAYWARVIFSGRTSPPLQQQSPDMLLNTVASNRGAIGYLDRSRVDGRVKVVLELENRTP
ncbi:MULTISPECIES: hypothetical protein [unclassified Azospira]|uniref:hypothetical protein n=1 Tax=unclassified Azospira TaxID=2609269 RepID=UPI001260FF87|nr:MULTISPECIES: hypothetical protein [unclassified Azospira]MBP7488961.1 hypothetical protein [Azospira sp.]MDK9689349.1 hypothetical protein [Azospira sp.]BBN87215.1 hypothetical protein AZSP09_02380 [Azospira sp. I09]